MSEINMIRGINVMRMLMKHTEHFVCLQATHNWLQCICNQCRLFIIYSKSTELTQYALTLYSLYNELYDRLTIINKNQYIDSKIML